MPNFVYDRGYTDFLTGATVLLLADLRVMLLNSSHVPTKTNRFVSDVVADEISAAGYARVRLTNKSIVEDNSGHSAYLSADDSVFPAMAAGQTFNYAVLYRNMGADGLSPLIALYVLPPTATTGASFTLQWANALNGKVFRVGAQGTGGGGGGATGGVNDWGNPDWDMVVWESNSLTPPRLKVTGSLITLDGGVIMTHTAAPPGTSASFTATFSSPAVSAQHIGFSSNLVSGPWAIVSSKDASGIYARTGDTSSETTTLLHATAYFGVQHVYRIDWSPTNVKYYVDDVLKATHSVVLSSDMQIVASDFAEADSRLLLIAQMTNAPL